MTLLLSPARIAERRTAARGSLAPLAQSLTSDLAPLLMDGFDLPREKARLSRNGGRCPDDASLLDFDPFSARSHRCPRCARVYDDEAHYRWWIMSYQLWLAERAVHGALLRLVTGNVEAGRLAESILDAYAGAYLEYPNRDNVLGPTRLFFSTYLESIWLLQVCVALDLLEAAGPQRARGATVRERIVEPSATLIRSYDEGASNRQVWNNAALLASSSLLGSYHDAEAIVWGPSGVVSHLAHGLLSDGTWYEGENYHLFAHRGLWYGVQMAERQELGLGESFVAPFIARFDEGFPASFASALPDLTLPSRRDSQYAISLRQWRFAELCELGLLRGDDARLRGMLERLYAADIPRGDVGRARSTAEAERNLPPSALGRGDLGWRSLLLARADLPPLQPEPARSVLLEGQGLAIFRRDAGAAFVALDYGHSGGGHGHPDRLNLQLAHGSVRWLDDMGTGSYVDPTLHWYRSTLAHNAPLFDGKSQVRVHGALRAFADDGEVGWVDATADGLAPGVRSRRTVVVMPGYLVDIFAWDADGRVIMDLPLHIDGVVEGQAGWQAAALKGGVGLEDGFGFLSDSAKFDRAAGSSVILGAEQGGRMLSAHAIVSCDHEWWRATAPGAPGKPRAHFLLVRADSQSGTVRTILDWSGSIHTVRFSEDTISVERRDGSTDVHRWRNDRWSVEWAGRGSRVLEAAGPRQSVPDPVPPAGVREPPRHGRAHPREIPTIRTRDAAHDGNALVLRMGESSYRRSELPWAEAGRPSARLSLGVNASVLHLTIHVRKEASVTFAPAQGHNDLDNEHPDINSDGLQLHLAARRDSEVLTWMLVPVAGGTTVRIRRPPDAPALDATCERTSGGYIVRCAIQLTPQMLGEGFDLDVIVNEMCPDRERRRGQLVLSGGRDEWIYLRGDRQSRDRLLPFVAASPERGA